MPKMQKLRWLESDLAVVSSTVSETAMDKPTLDRLSQINDDLVLHLQWLMEKKDLDSLAKLIPIVDRLTHGVAQLSGIVSSRR